MSHLLGQSAEYATSKVVNALPDAWILFAARKDATWLMPILRKVVRVTRHKLDETTGFVVLREGDPVTKTGFGALDTWALHGTVVRNRQGKLRVKITHGRSAFGLDTSKKGRVVDLDEGWHHSYEPLFAARGVLADAERRARRSQHAREAAERADALQAWQAERPTFAALGRMPYLGEPVDAFRIGHGVAFPHDDADSRYIDVYYDGYDDEMNPVGADIRELRPMLHGPERSAVLRRFLDQRRASATAALDDAKASDYVRDWASEQLRKLAQVERNNA
jgi:hypothetical protein